MVSNLHFRKITILDWRLAYKNVFQLTNEQGVPSHYQRPRKAILCSVPTLKYIYMSNQ